MTTNQEQLSKASLPVGVGLAVLLLVSLVLAAWAGGSCL
jgi:hypothetical protein